MVAEGVCSGAAGAFMSDHIYLTGFMGCGKSTVGTLLAAALKRRFLDMDAVLVKRLQMPIADYFAKHGEAAFRDAESALLAELAGASERLVISTGGGVVEREGNRKLMKRSGRRVFLKATLEECASRLAGKDRQKRPMWSGDRGRVEALFFRRLPLYTEAELTQNTDGKSPEALVASLRRSLFPDDNFSVRMEGVECPVACSFDALDLVCSGLQGRKLAILTDRRVAKMHLPRYLKTLPDALVIELPGGEGIKTLRTAEKVYRQLLEHHFNRDDLLMAVGGGTVTDLGAYIASTYKRGMPFVLASTTLLGCVDAAVGGKAAVNLGDAKNIIGTFTIPELVVLDAGSFATLPPAQISEGLFEAYKTGLIETPKLAALIEDNIDALLAGDLPLLKEVAAQSARTKAKVVSGDFRESGRRAILNYGHTYGHAIEGYYKYKVSHGMSVGAGMIVATILSKRRGMLPADESRRMIDTTLKIARGKLPALPPLEDSLEIMSHDKKIREGRLVFILLEKTGKAIIVNDLRKPELKAALAEAAKELA